MTILKSLKYKNWLSFCMPENNCGIYWIYVTCPRYVLWFKDSTHRIYWLTKWLKKSLKQFTDQIKKQKKYQGVRNELSIKDNIKALKYKSCLSFCACQKKIVQFTNSTNTIYWPTCIAKKAANCWKKSFYICQY